MKQTKKKFENVPFAKQTDDNLSYEQQQALQNIMLNEEIIAKPSDKGGNIVIMDKCQYITMCNKMLSNHEWYKKVPLESITEARQQISKYSDRRISTILN